VSTFDRYLSGVIATAETEARLEGATTVEAYHLLLAIAREGRPALGLDHAAVRAALDREFEQSLAAAGVRIEGGLPPATPSEVIPGLGASAKAALERGFGAVSRKRDCRPGHVLLGVLQAEVGTVPRALALAGVDRAELIERVQQEVDG